MRGALDDAAPLYRDAPEARIAKAPGDRIRENFLHKVLPHVADPQRALATELISTTLSTIGKSFSERPRDAAEIIAFADAIADMFCAYIDRLDG